VRAEALGGVLSAVGGGACVSAMPFPLSVSSVFILRQVRCSQATAV